MRLMVRHDRSLSFLGDDNRLPAKGRIISLLDGGVDRVHVDVDNPAHRGSSKSPAMDSIVSEDRANTKICDET